MAVFTTIFGNHLILSREVLRHSGAVRLAIRCRDLCSVMAVCAAVDFLYPLMCMGVCLQHMVFNMYTRAVLFVMHPFITHMGSAYWGMQVWIDSNICEVSELSS